MTSRIPGFYNYSLEERGGQLIHRGVLTPEEFATLKGGPAGLSAEQADHMIENVIGRYALPIGLGLNFIINGREVLIPMVVEEPSIVAGASFMAKLARPTGGFFAHTTPPEMIGQIQILDLPEPHSARLRLLEHKEELLSLAAEIDPILQKLGGGPRDLEVRLIADSPIGAFLVAHLIYDVRDAMGANAINTACERLAPHIERITGGRVHLRILSNLADRRLARARVTIRTADLAFADFSGQQVRDGIIAAWAFAAADPYRAATHNKGIMNGVDAVILATGNDWRAIEAGAHAYAARSGRYTSLSTWCKDADGNLTGTRNADGGGHCRRCDQSTPRCTNGAQTDGCKNRRRPGQNCCLCWVGAKPGGPARPGHRRHSARAHEFTCPAGGYRCRRDRCPNRTHRRPNGGRRHRPH